MNLNKARCNGLDSATTFVPFSDNDVNVQGIPGEDKMRQ